MIDPASVSFAFFGTDAFSVRVLEQLLSRGFAPKLIITVPDRPVGRKQIMTASPAKEWGIAHGIPVLQPEKLSQEAIAEINAAGPFDIFALASYGKIIPQAVLDIPSKGALNVHPSLLPLLRGSSPIETAILQDMKKTGVSIMLMDAQMDHGPILAQETYEIGEWPAREALEATLADKGGALLAQTIDGYLEGTISPQEQDHAAATFTKKIAKADAEISNPLEASAEEQYGIFRKIQAYSGWPQAHFFIIKEDRKIRVIVTSARFENNALRIERVIPEGGKEMSFEDFKRGFYKN